MTARFVVRGSFASMSSVLALAAAGAQAQSMPAATPDTPAQAEVEAVAAGETADSQASAGEIVVTGSRISRRDYVSNSPISTIGEASFQRSGSVTLDTALTQAPQFTASTGSTTNSNANGGQANIQLRGLGRARTLVLLDGRRLPAANPDSSVDINVIPAALVQNVEVITGGASAVYGSDAIAGVVNFKLRRPFDGVEVSAQTGISDEGDAGDRRISLAAGKRFAGDRGSIMLSGEYAQRDSIFVADRNWTFGANRDAVAPFGSVSFAATNLPSQTALNAVFGRYGVAAGVVAPGNGIGFNADGTLFSSGIAVANYRGPSDPDYAVSNGRSLTFDGRRFRYLQLPLERFSGFGRASFEVSDALTLSLQGLYTRTETGNSLNPAPVPGSRGIANVPITNPFIPADFRTLLASRANPTATFNVDLRPDQLGARRADFTYDTFQVTAGADGRIGLGDWSYNLSGIYGHNKIDTLQTNFVSASRVNALVRAADGGASLCAGGFNPFGNQPISAACAAYISPDLNNSTRLTQKIVEGSLQGGLFTLPGGQVRAALGADYRRDSYANIADPRIVAGDILAANASQSFAGAIDVSELFAELSIPILANRPFFHALNLDLAYRYSDYSTVGGVHTYKADGYWEPVRGIRLRGGYERAIRAPNIGEVFVPQSVGATIIGLAGALGSGDPCDVRGAYRAGANAGQVRGLCLAQGVPNILIDNYSFSQQSIQIQGGGNPALREEKADTYSIGAVLSPDFDTSLLKGFSLSVDYYSISLKDAVGSITSTISLARCFNADGVSNTGYSNTNFFCSLIARDPNSGAIAQAQELLFNLGGYKTTGVDVQASWQSDLGAAGSLAFNIVGSYLDTFKIQSLPGDPFLDYAGTIGNGQIDPVAISRPQYKAVVDATYSSGRFRAGLRWRYIGKMDSAANVGTNGTAAGVGAVSYFDVNAGVSVGEAFDLFGNIANVGDRKPPAYPSAGSTDLATYDAIGRKFTIGVRARF